jgi:arabinogalactan oligomer/maltooligosaccharide transport system permease protein
MSSWSGRRRFFTVLAFIAPTLIGILIFNIYPIIYNTYISFTNRNQYHPNPDCSVTLTSIIEPTCWSVFRGRAPTGTATPFSIVAPFFKNYTDLLGGLFNTKGVIAVVEIFLCLVPLVVANYVNKYYDKQVSRPISGLIIWIAAAVIVILLGWLINISSALDVIQKSGDFFVVVFRTILYVIACIPLFFTIGLILALILNTKYIKGRTFFRAVMIVPWAASTMAIMMSLIWQFFFRDQGTINQILKVINIKGPVYLQNPGWAFAIVVLVNLWYSYPFFFSIILGALQSIPADQYEAAEMDGANYWQQLMNITLPLIRPAILPAVVLSSISTFQMFGTVWAITAGGPSRGAGTPGFTEFVMIYAYKQVFQYNAYATAGAFAVVIFIFLFLATLYSMRLTRLTQGAN